LRKEGIDNIATVPVGAESPREIYGPDYTRPSKPKTNLLIMQRRLVELMRAFLYRNRQVH